MISYSEYSTLTVRRRIDKAFKSQWKHDKIVTIHNNRTSEGTICWFYLSDWDNPNLDCKDLPEMDFRVDNETKSQKYLTLGINYARSKPSEQYPRFV